MGKGSRQRKMDVSHEENDLRWALLSEKDPVKKEKLLEKLNKLLEEKRGLNNEDK